MEIINYQGDNAILSPAVSARIADFEREIKTLTDARDKLKKAIMEAMEENNVVKCETDDLVITYIAETDRESFDSKAFRYDYPDVYDDYVRISKVKPSIRIKVK